MTGEFRRPKVSIILPTHNRPDSLRKAISSVISQTYNSIELIVVDDASVSNPEEIVDSFRQGAKIEIIYLRNSQRKGGAESRNIGIGSSSGDLISFLDDDDEILPGKIEKQADFLLSNPEVDCLSCWYIEEGAGNRGIRRKFDLPSFEEMLYRNRFGGFSFSMLRRKALDKIGFIDGALFSCHDWEFWLRAWPRSNMAVFPDYLVVYHRHAGNISSLSARTIASYERVVRINSKYMDAKCLRFHNRTLALSHAKLMSSKDDKIREFNRRLRVYGMNRLSDIGFALYGRMSLSLDGSNIKNILKRS